MITYILQVAICNYSRRKSALHSVFQKIKHTLKTIRFNNPISPLIQYQGAFSLYCGTTPIQL